MFPPYPEYELEAPWRGSCGAVMRMMAGIYLENKKTSVPAIISALLRRRCLNLGAQKELT